MFCFFAVFAVQQPEPAYNLVPPFEQTDVGEIGNWTTRGTTVVMKNSIRLTSGVSHSFGSVCQRVPTLFKEWSVELEINAKIEGGTPGNGIWFFFTEEVCPDVANQFSGFSIWFNTSLNDEGYNEVYFHKSNGSEFSPFNLKPVGKFPSIYESKKPLRLHISRRFNTLTIDATKDIILDRILTEDVKGVPDYGYFSISGHTGSFTASQHDLLSMRVYSMSEVNHPNATFDFAAKNKKYITDMVETRRIHKRNRRANMPVSNKYNKQSKDLDRTLEENPNYPIKDAISILDEAYLRGMSSMTPNALEKFIVDNIDTTVQEALRKIEVAQSKYDETQTDLDELWSSLKKQLLELAMEAKATMTKIQIEVNAIAKEMNLTTHNPDELKRKLKAEVETNVDNTGINWFMIISAIEITAYISWFLYKHTKTSGFKKYD